MPVRSAGILLYRGAGPALEVLLVHPGGPFFARKDAGAWGIPKGECAAGEEPLATARREFAEETGHALAPTPSVDLGEVRQGSGKIVRAWAVEGDLDADRVTSNTFVLEWPPGSGRQQAFPEVDRAAWLGLDEAATKILPGQRPLIDRLARALGVDGTGG